GQHSGFQEAAEGEEGNEQHSRPAQSIGNHNGSSNVRRRERTSGNGGDSYTTGTGSQAGSGGQMRAPEAPNAKREVRNPTPFQFRIPRYSLRIPTFPYSETPRWGEEKSRLSGQVVRLKIEN